VSEINILRTYFY